MSSFVGNLETLVLRATRNNFLHLIIHNYRFENHTKKLNLIFLSCRLQLISRDNIQYISQNSHTIKK